MNIPKKYTDMCTMRTLEESIEIHGDNLDTHFTFCDTFLSQSDKRVLQYLRECSLSMETSLTFDEYMELEKCRQYCVEQLRALQMKANEAEDQRKAEEEQMIKEQEEAYKKYEEALRAEEEAYKKQQEETETQ